MPLRHATASLRARRAAPGGRVPAAYALRTVFGGRVLVDRRNGGVDYILPGKILANGTYR